MNEFLDNFFLKALISGILIAVAAAPLGCLIVWKKMAYFGDALAHASILGVALSLSFSFSILFGVLLIAILTAILITLSQNKGYEIDTSLGVISHSALAIGLVIASFLSGINLDLMAYLFGDILTITDLEVILILCGTILTSLIIYFRWHKLLISTIDEDMAYSLNLRPKLEQFILNITLAILIAISIKAFGVLLIVSLLIIPPAGVRFFSKNPETMVLLSLIFSIVSVIIGINSSFIFDVPTGPSIVTICTLLFLISMSMRFIFKAFKQKKH